MSEIIAIVNQKGTVESSLAKNYVALAEIY